MFIKFYCKDIVIWIFGCLRIYRFTDFMIPSKDNLMQLIKIILPLKRHYLQHYSKLHVNYTGVKQLNVCNTPLGTPDIPIDKEKSKDT